LERRPPATIRSATTLVSSVAIEGMKRLLELLAGFLAADIDIRNPFEMLLARHR
jgi:hypothetical protein